MLFEPITINGMTLRNRLVMPPMVTQLGDSSGLVTRRQIDYYVERAKNHVGLIIVEGTCPVIGGRVAANQLGAYEDKFIPGLAQLAEAIKQTGARCALQLQHAGRRSFAKDNGGLQPVSSTAMAMRNGEMPRALTLEDIPSLVEGFASAARRAKQAGFDAVEGHFAHGYLIAQFLSPLINKRTDAYGGDLASRARFPVEIVRRIRQVVGPGFPIMVRICGDEYIKGGLTLRDTQKVARMLEEAGVDAIDVSAGYTASHEEGYLNSHIPYSSAPMSLGHGSYLHLAEGIKKAVKVPVIAVGRLDEHSLAEDALAKGKADLISAGRGLIADPALWSKVKENKTEDIRKCIACNHCVSNLMIDTRLGCTVNPEVGMEAAYRPVKSSKPRRILIIGGGPAGMEAARVAALRGHRVTLFEKKPYLGGNLVPAAAPQFKHDIATLTEYLSKQVRKLGVEIRLGAEADEASITGARPDVVILATGASPLIPDIPGIKGGNVVTAIDVLENRAKTGGRVVVAGAGSVGCETAVVLVQAGKEVAIVEMRETDFSDRGGLALDMNPLLRRWLLFELWPDLPIEVIGKSTFREVTRDGLVVENREGKTRLVPADTIVLAAGMKPENGLKAKLSGKVPELFEAGDCIAPRNIIDAISEAARIAHAL